MADFLFNISKGRFVEYFNRVDSNDPANSAIIVVPVDVGAATDATLRDVDTLAAVIAAGVTERSTNNWNRKTLTDTDIGPFAPDDPNDRFPIDIPDITWTPGPTSGNVTDLVFCYDSDTTAGTDANIVPIFQYDFVIIPDGSDVVAAINASGLAWAA
jgi:hypothetical protein